MGNHVRKSIKFFCTHPSQFHIKDGKFPPDTDPSHQQPHQKALSKRSHVYCKVARECDRGFGEKEPVLQQALQSGLPSLELLMIYVWPLSTKLCAKKLE